MSDWLTHLADRSLGREGVVEPRLRSLFELPSDTPPPDPAIVHMQPTTDRTNTDTRLSAPVPKVTRPRHMVASTSTSSVPTVSSQQTEVQHQPIDRNQEPHPSPSSLVKASPSDHGDQSSTELAPHIVKTMSGDVAAKQPKLKPVELETEPPVEKKTSRSSEPKTEPEAEKKADQSVKPDTSSPAMIQPQVASPLPIIPPTQDSLPVPVTRSLDETTINVTIGRVEVRAVPPEPQVVPKRRAVSSVLSLDEYLRQRARGIRS